MLYLAINEKDFCVQSEFLDMSLQNNENDSMLAAKLMDELEKVKALIKDNPNDATLGAKVRSSNL